MLIAQDGISPQALRGLRVTGLGFTGGAAADRNRKDIDIQGLCPECQRQPVTYPNQVSGFDAFAGNLDLAARNRVRGKRSRLVDARMPEPFVEPIRHGYRNSKGSAGAAAACARKSASSTRLEFHSNIVDTR